MLGGRAGGVPLMTLEYVLKKNGLTIGTNTEAGEVNVRTDVQFGVMAGAFAGGEADFIIHPLLPLYQLNYLNFLQ